MRSLIGCWFVRAAPPLPSLPPSPPQLRLAARVRVKIMGSIIIRTGG
jgi:hypothetical protein